MPDRASLGVTTSGRHPHGEPGSDRALVARSLEEPAAFEELFERHHAAIHRYVARRLSRTCADDVAAQAFCIAFDRRRQLIEQRPDCPVAAWLFGIATNLVRRHRRDERRQLRAYARLGAADAGADPQGDADARLDARRAAPQVARALAALSRDERDVLLLYALADLDYQGIAEALEIPIGTVRSRLARARTRARRHLAGDAGPLTITASETEEGSCATST
jgi:RNA polymerase sigma-70 factor (ECF subfamily)